MLFYMGRGLFPCFFLKPFIADSIISNSLKLYAMYIAQFGIFKIFYLSIEVKHLRHFYADSICSHLNLVQVSMKQIYLLSLL